MLTPILGGSGRTTLHPIKEELTQGYKLNYLLLTKSITRTKHDKQKIFEGPPLAKTALEVAMNGSEAMVNTLKIPRTSHSSWAKLKSLSDFISLFMTHLIYLSKNQLLKRIVIPSAWDVLATKTKFQDDIVHL